MTTKIDKAALAKRFLKLGQQEQAKFIALLDAKGMSFETLPIVACDENKRVPLSPAQKRLWDIYQLDMGNSAYHISGGFELDGSVDESAIERALRQVMEKHHSLRTRFIADNGEPLQYVETAILTQVELIDGRYLSPSQADRIRADFIERPFDLYHDMPLRLLCLKVADNKTHLIVAMHHIVSDGWSIGLLIKDLVSAYQGISLAPLAIQYRDFSLWQSALLKAGKGQSELDFWEKELGCVQPEKLFEWKGKVVPNQRRESAQIVWDLPRERAGKFAQLAQHNKVTTSSLWLSLWQIALAKVSGRRDIRIGMPMANRTRPEVGDVIGFFVNTNVIKQYLEPQQTLAHILAACHNKMLDIQEQQLLPFDQVVASLLTTRVVGETPYFQVLFNHQVNQTESVEFSAGVFAKPLGLQGQYALFDVALDVLESSDKTRVTLTYAKDRIDSDTMESLGRVLQQIASDVEANLNTSLAGIDPLGPDLHRRLAVLSQPQGNWFYRPVSEFFDRQSAQQPEAVALKHGQDTYTFSQVEKRSNQLAQQLVSLGVQRDQAIGVLFERGCEMIIAMIAVMKAGGAFLPLDPDYPTDRLAYMLDDSNADIVLSSHRLSERWQEVAEQFVSDKVAPLYLEALPWPSLPEQKPNIAILPDQLAYIIYTSGSTGKPKGVAIAHDGLSMHVQTIGEQYGMTPDDVELHFASISFDGAIERWAVPLAFGSRLVIRDQQLWSAEQTCRILEQERITIACFPPSYVGPLLDWIEQTRPSLRVRSWTLGGEAFTRETYERLQSVVQPPRIINGYGPTETVVTPLIWRAYPDDTLSSAYAPIGQPVGDRKLYVLDDQLNRVAPTLIGELYIGEESGLARGYLAKPDMTAERFIPDPFSPNGQRMYRTGDLVRWRSDGVMEYFGRVDQQIKIRGFRVELGEIESRLQHVSKVETCIVAAHRHGANIRLVGYLHGSGAQFVVLDDVLQALSTYLPEYMVPSCLIVLTELPLTPAGKVDRNALPEPDFQSASSLFVAPEGDKETLLADIWQVLLNRERISRCDSFFALGGDSILSLQLVSKLKLAGFNVTPKQVFETPILSELAQILQVNQEQELRQLTMEPFGLMPIQAHFMKQNFAQPNHWNQHVCVELKQDMDILALDAAVTALVKHHPSLRVAYNQTNGQWQQTYRSDMPENRVWQAQLEEERDFSAFAHELQTSLNIESARLIQAGYAQMKGKKSRLMIVIHHLAVDGVSWRILMDDLWRAYQQASSKQTIELQPCYTSLDMAVARLEAWMTSSEGRERQALWSSQFGETNQTPAAPKAEYRDKRSVRVELSREATSSLMGSNNITAEMVTALKHTLSNEQNSMTLYLESHGREESVFGELDLSRLVGWMTSLYPVIIKRSDTIDSVTKRLQALNQDAGIGFGVRSLLNEAQEVPAELTFNYLGQYQGSGFSHWCQPIDSGSEDQAPANTMLTPLVVNAQIVDGVLSADFEFGNQHFSQQEIEQKAASWVKNLEALHRSHNASQIIADVNLLDRLNDEVAAHPPVFCVHPVTGRTVGYQKLAQALAGHRTVYGIQSQSIVYPNRFESSFDSMADCYYSIIRQIQPKGPYTLVGWSLGGALCQEVAARLESAGERVEFLGLLDCYVPGTEITEDQWSSPEAKTKLVEHLEILLGSLTQEQKQGCLEGLDCAPPKEWPKVFSDWLSRQQFDYYAMESAQQMLYSWAVEQHMRALCQGYQLPNINCSSRAYWAGQPSGRSQLLSHRLEETTELFSQTVYDTDHLGIVQHGPVIRDLTQALIKGR
ncbi:amino acid adenylation domain-containing protein [Vibrio ostreicida]|uniref:non-ribosomal peptide synthetase n=1 Tax=Vibrio ostreicida TaxID=526588 RepID=UPI003B591108